MTSRLIYTIITFYSFFLISVQSVCGQQSSSQNSSIHQNEVWFDNLVGFENSGIINGPEYFAPGQGLDTHPFYGTRELSYESIVFQGQPYGKVGLMYDIYNDIVILRHRDKHGIFVLIEMDKVDVDGFTLYGHQFEKLSVATSNGKIQSPQFYDILVKGETLNLIAKRRKITRVIGSRPEYQNEEKFYFLINNQIFPINNRKNIYKAMSGENKRIKEFINKNKLNTKGENDLISIARFCDTLNSLAHK